MILGLLEMLANSLAGALGEKLRVPPQLLDQVDPLCGFLSKQTYCAGS